MAILLIELAWKSTVLLSLAGLLIWMLRRQSAGLRHLVWKLGCLCLLLLPLGQALIPGWSVLPSSWVASQNTALTDTPASSPSAVVLPNVVTSRPSVQVPMEPTTDPVSISQLQDTNNKGTRHATQVAAETSAPSVYEMLLRWAAWLSLIWAVGASVLILRLLLYTLRLWQNTSRLPLVEHEEVLATFKILKHILALQRTICLRQASPKTMPMVWGIWTPQIIVPETIESWPIEQQRSVLLHELAHVKRRDPLWQAVFEVTKALYWPQPCLWLAVRSIDRLREQACDDLVLNTGVSADDYARSLLDVVSQGRLRRMWPAVGVAIVSTPSIEMRLRTILDRTVNRLAVSRRAFGMLLLITAIASTSLVAIRLKAMQQQIPFQHRLKKPRMSI